jgi:hypothetical protein
MVLIQLLLPLYSNDKRPIARELFVQVRDELVICKVMIEQLDRQWWTGYRTELEKRFQQDALILRTQEIRTLQTGKHAALAKAAVP